MTRINVAIAPRKLTDRHLLAEHREIKRIPNALAKYGVNLNLKNLPKEFTLGTGHVRFFYDKGLYTYNRYIEIYKECKLRNFNVEFYGDAWHVYKDYPSLYKDYAPTDKDFEAIKKRLVTKDKRYIGLL